MSSPDNITSSVKAELQYLAESTKHNTNENEMPIYYASQAGDKDEARHQGQFEMQKVIIHDARPYIGNWNLDIHGFQLIQNVKSNIQDFFNDSEIEQIYNQEVIKLLLDNIPGATRIHVFDHTRRASTPELRSQLKCREPTSIIHNDYTTKSAWKRLHTILLGNDDDDNNNASTNDKNNNNNNNNNDDETTLQTKKRFSIVNVWRSIAGTVQICEMTFCDSTSLKSQDLVSVKRVAKDRIGELQLAYYNPKHQWYYFPQMTMEEVALFKTFDSSTDVNQFTLHSSFSKQYNTTTLKDTIPPRQSIETRCFVFYD